MEQDIQIQTKPPRHFPTNNSISNNKNDDHRSMKRDEWSEEAVSCLLEAYEAKWSLRKRAKLRGRDWHDVAECVSAAARAKNSKTEKTHMQCKNKIEAMKKRYRSELAAAATGDSSSWPLYRRIDRLLRGNGKPTKAPTATPSAVLEVENSIPPPQPLPPPPPAYNSHGSISIIDRCLAKEDGYSNGPKVIEPESNKIEANGTNSSTHAVNIQREDWWNTKTKIGHYKKNGDRRLGIDGDRRLGIDDAKEEWEKEKSMMMKWVAEVMVRNEKARMETMREIERIRMEAQVKRGEFDLKRTEIIANAQLQIAKLFAKFGEVIQSEIGQ